MLIFFSLLAASVDGFISGFILGGMGVKFRFIHFTKSLVIIFICCVTAAVAGNILAQTQLQNYINTLGILIMLFLALSAFRGNMEYAANQTGLASLTVAADASVLCMYLALCGYSVLIVSFASALLHSSLMWTGALMANKIIKTGWLIYTRYIAGVIFLIMALVKAFDFIM